MVLERMEKDRMYTFLILEYKKLKSLINEIRQLQ